MVVRERRRGLARQLPPGRSRNEGYGGKVRPDNRKNPQKIKFRPRPALPKAGLFASLKNRPRKTGADFYVDLRGKRSINAGDMEHKTNAVRMLEQKKIPHEVLDCGITEAVSGTQMAQLLGENPDSVFKTLVTAGKSGEHYVFMIPVGRELDLKKAAAAVGEKSVAMIKSKDLLPTTGYVHGGCSPIGMKKPFRTAIDSSAKNFEKILFSAGRIGMQIKAPAGAVEKFVRTKYADLTV